MFRLLGTMKRMAKTAPTPYYAKKKIILEEKGKEHSSTGPLCNWKELLACSMASTERFTILYRFQRSQMHALYILVAMK